MEPNRDDRWISDRLAALEPRWQADVAHGRSLLDAGLAPRRRTWVWAAAPAAVAVCAAVALALPQTRAFAQQLWYSLVLKHVDVVRLDLSDLPLHAHVTTNGLQQAARDLDDASVKAGYLPYLPSPGVLAGNPSLGVIGLIQVEQTIRVGDLETALRKRAAGDVAVPREWEGVQLRARIGPMVSADYPDGAQVLQTPPIELSIPGGFPLAHFVEVAFRSLGVSLWESRALAQKFVANPGWILDIPPGEAANIREVQLRTGPALLIEDVAENDRAQDPQRVTVILNTAERIYLVSAGTSAQAIRMAEALP